MTEPIRVSAEAVKRLRELTGAGMMDCKSALIEAEGNEEKAIEILRARGQAGIEKRAGRRASQGVIESYIHGEGTLGVLVEVNCETDFVARTPEFRQLAREVAMQVAALDPSWVARDDVPQDVIDGERKIYREQVPPGKPDTIAEKIIDGKLEAFFEQAVLLDQKYIRDDSKRVRDLVHEVGAKVGENVLIRRFVRFRLGEEG